MQPMATAMHQKRARAHTHTTSRTPPPKNAVASRAPLYTRNSAGRRKPGIISICGTAIASIVLVVGMTAETTPSDHAASGAGMARDPPTVVGMRARPINVFIQSATTALHSFAPYSDDENAVAAVV